MKHEDHRDRCRADRRQPSFALRACAEGRRQWWRAGRRRQLPRRGRAAGTTLQVFLRDHSDKAVASARLQGHRNLRHRRQAAAHSADARRRKQADRHVTSCAAQASRRAPCRSRRRPAARCRRNSRKSAQEGTITGSRRRSVHAVTGCRRCPICRLVGSTRRRVKIGSSALATAIPTGAPVTRIDSGLLARIVAPKFVAVGDDERADFGVLRGPAGRPAAGSRGPSTRQRKFSRLGLDSAMTVYLRDGPRGQARSRAVARGVLRSSDGRALSGDSPASMRRAARHSVTPCRRRRRSASGASGCYAARRRRYVSRRTAACGRQDSPSGSCTAAPPCWRANCRAGAYRATGAADLSAGPRLRRRAVRLPMAGVIAVSDDGAAAAKLARLRAPASRRIAPLRFI